MVGAIRFLRRVANFFGYFPGGPPSLPTVPPDRMREITCALYGPCTLCGDSLRGHGLAYLASAIVVENGTSVPALRGLVAAQEWRRAAEFQEWRGDEDELEYQLVRCPWSRQLTILEIRSFAALELDDFVLSRIVLDRDATAALEQQVTVQWQSV